MPGARCFEISYSLWRIWLLMNHRKLREQQRSRYGLDSIAFEYERA